MKHRIALAVIISTAPLFGMQPARSIDRSEIRLNILRFMREKIPLDTLFERILPAELTNTMVVHAYGNLFKGFFNRCLQYRAWFYPPLSISYEYLPENEKNPAESSEISTHTLSQTFNVIHPINHAITYCAEQDGELLVAYTNNRMRIYAKNGNVVLNAKLRDPEATITNLLKCTNNNHGVTSLLVRFSNGRLSIFPYQSHKRIIQRDNNNLRTARNLFVSEKTPGPVCSLALGNAPDTILFATKNRFGFCKYMYKVLHENPNPINNNECTLQWELSGIYISYKLNELQCIQPGETILNIAQKEDNRVCIKTTDKTVLLSPYTVEDLAIIKRCDFSLETASLIYRLIDELLDDQSSSPIDPKEQHIFDRLSPNMQKTLYHPDGMQV